MRRIISTTLAAAVLAGGAFAATTASAQYLGVGARAYVSPGVYVDTRVRTNDRYYGDRRRHDNGRHHGWKKHHRGSYAYNAPRCSTQLVWDNYRGRYVQRTYCRR